MKKLSHISNLLMVLLACCLWHSCGNTSASQTFEQNFQRFIANDSTITPMEYNNLLQTIQQAPGFQVVMNGETFSMNNEDALKTYIRNSGATCSLIEEDVSFDKMSIYLENSASMAGYSNAGNPLFTAPILALFNAIEANTEIETAYVGEKDRELKLSVIPRSTFERELTNGKIAKSEGSPLDRIIMTMVDSVTDNSVIGLITDGIVSGSNEEIISSTGRDFTIKNLPLIEQRIRGEISKAAAKNVSMLLYRLETAYTGTYYDYKNYKHNVTNVVRPYYIMLIGNVTNLKKVEAALANESKFTPTHKFSSHEVNAYNTITKGFLATTTNVDAIVIPNTGTIDFKNKVPSIPINLSLRVALNGVPSHYHNEDIIRKHLEVFYIDKSSNIEVMKPEFIQGIDKDASGVNVYNIALQIDNNFIQTLQENTKLYVRLKGSVDRWDTLLSSDEDIQFGLLPDSRTFALTTLMDGICNGFGFNKGLNDVIKIELTINK